MKIANPSANGRVRNPTSRAKLPRNSVSIPTTPMGTGIPYLSFQLSSMPFIPRPPDQPKICCVEWAKKAIARPKRKKTKAKDGAVSKIQLTLNLRAVSLLDEILHRHLALLEARIVFHSLTNPCQVIISIHTKQLIAGKMIEQKRVNTHLIKFADRPRSQGIMLFLAEGKGLYRFYGIFLHLFAKSSVVVC